MSKQLHAVVLGAGFIGRVHAAAARAAGADLYGVLASTPTRSAAAANELGATRAYATAQQAIEDPQVDVVHVCTPNALHHEQAAAAIDAGKHVVCEKPLATCAADAADLARQAGAAGVIGAVPFAYRYHAMAREARARVLAGEVGAPKVIHGSYLQDWMLSPLAASWRVDPEVGGPSRAFADIGSHWCDLAEWISGQRIMRVSAAMSTTVPKRPGATAATFSADASALEGDGEVVDVLDVRTEDVACVLLRTDGEAVGTVVASQVSAGRKNRLWLEIDGQDGSVCFDQEDAEHLWLGGREAVRVLTRDASGLAEQAQAYSVLPAGHAQGFQDCFTMFVAEVYRSIEQGAPVPGLPTFADGARAAALTSAVLDSAASHTWTEV